MLNYLIYHLFCLLTFPLQAVRLHVILVLLLSCLLLWHNNWEQVLSWNISPVFCQHTKDNNKKWEEKEREVFSFRVDKKIFIDILKNLTEDWH